MDDPEQRPRRRGRPPMPREEARAHRVVTFVTECEFERLRCLSQQLQLPLSTTVYRILSERLGSEGPDKS